MDAVEILTLVEGLLSLGLFAALSLVWQQQADGTSILLPILN